MALFEGVAELWIRPLGTETSRLVPGSEGADSPFWSPDGKEIGFFVTGKNLMKVSAAGGSPTVLCAAGTPFGGNWRRDGLVLFSAGGALHAVPESGGSPRPVLSLDGARGEIGQAWPSILPDGRRFVYISINRDRAQHAIMLASFDNPRGKILFRNFSRAVFAPPDYLLFVRDGTLYVQRWDFTAAKSRDEPRAIIQEVNASMFGRAAFNGAESGALAYRAGALSRNQLVCYSRDGKRIRNIGPAGPYIQVTLSPDEKTAAFHSARSMFELPARIWLMRLESEVVSRHEFVRSGNADAVWSPDSRQIAFAAFDMLGPPPSDILVWIVGEPSARILLADGAVNKPADWSPDGKFVLFRKNERIAFLMPIAPGSKPAAIGDTNTRMGHIRFSPDGRLVAYDTTLLGRSEVLIARFPGMKDTVQVSAAGGMQPMWTRGRKELIYAAPDNQWMAIEIRARATLEASAPRPLFRSAAVFHPWLNQYAVSPDGQRFYVLEPSGSNHDAWHIFTRWQELTQR